MRVAITTTDSAVSVDGVWYAGLDLQCVPADIHAIQWYGDVGEIEYRVAPDGTKRPNTTITSLDPYKGALDAWAEADFREKHPVPPEPVPPTAEENKTTASNRLFQTDWTQLPSVSDTAVSNPYLVNAAEFAAYRNAIRAIVVNPAAGFIDWPILPSAIWSS